jgi:hypothetical protein
MPEFIGSDQGGVFQRHYDLFLDLEALLAQAVEPFAPLIALGLPREQIGAGRVRCNEETWQQELELLARGASFIFVLPSDRSGTRWEIEWLLKNDLTEKCLFLMPPEQLAATLVKKDRHRSFRWAETWKTIAAEICKVGLQLPAYKTTGMIFTMGTEGKVKYWRSLRLPNRKPTPGPIIREHIRRLRDCVGVEPAQLASETSPYYITCSNCRFEQWEGYSKCQKCG